MDHPGRCAILAVAVLASIVAGEASPSTAPGLRILPDPALTHWPAIAYAGEARHAAFTVWYHDPGLHRLQPVFPGTVPRAGDDVVIGWAGAGATVSLPVGREGIGGLLPIPGPGSHRGIIAGHAVALRVVPATENWPMSGLDRGHPVDASGAAVVLLDRRIDRAGDRAFRWLGGSSPRPSGSPLVLGPAAEVGGLPGQVVPCDHPTYPHHRALVALAELGRNPAPRTILWVVGSESLASGAWREEDRLLGAVRSRCEALGIRPRLVLVLPGPPAEPHPDHEARRRLLRAAARSQEWQVVDLGVPVTEEIAPGVHAPTVPRPGLRDRLLSLLAD